MPKTIQIRDIDDEVYAALSRRAAEAGLTVPDLLRRRASADYDGDLLGTLVIAVLVLAMSAATVQASIIAAGTGVVAGLVVGLALTRLVRRP